MPPRAPLNTDDAIFEQAAAWLARVRDSQTKSGDAEALHEEFDRWLNEDPSHAQAFAEAERLWGRLEMPVRNLLLSPATKCRWTIRNIAAAAALLIIAASAVLSSNELVLHMESDHMTAVGDQSPVELGDGTRIILNTNSAISVEMTQDLRHVRLLRGEAWFDVAQDVDRPFAVETEMGTVRVTGTRFNLRTDHVGVEVSLTEGQVELSSRHDTAAPVVLAPGEAARLTDKGISRPQVFDPAAVTAWLHQQFVFFDTPLSKVVDEINRYHRGKIVIASAEFRNLRVSGVFRTDDPDAALTVIATTLGLETIRLTDFFVVLL